MVVGNMAISYRDADFPPPLVYAIFLPELLFLSASDFQLKFTLLCFAPKYTYTRGQKVTHPISKELQ